ncbi:helix-turn-helix domain-containing protein [Pseudobutyrivibrio sp. LB2011]|uniref:helix-turn-helix domain-containing protein n=1 Tax=Pseudobutyrivibrio sp. LB2011 TaxID=1408312 RepID=UPI0005D23D49|nr:helix-turn-helix transcriptional regulator [Pseudobutyrivibrio sp. LB2011]
MAVSYKKLWKTLIDKGMNKTELRQKARISSSTMAKMTNGEAVTLTTIERICEILDCQIEDVVEIEKDCDSNR